MQVIGSIIIISEIINRQIYMSGSLVISTGHSQEFVFSLEKARDLIRRNMKIEAEANTDTRGDALIRDIYRIACVCDNRNKVRGNDAYVSQAICIVNIALLLEMGADVNTRSSIRQDWGDKINYIPAGASLIWMALEKTTSLDLVKVLLCWGAPIPPPLSEEETVSEWDLYPKPFLRKKEICVLNQAKKDLFFENRNLFLVKKVSPFNIIEIFQRIVMGGLNDYRVPERLEARFLQQPPLQFKA